MARHLLNKISFYRKTGVLGSLVSTPSTKETLFCKDWFSVKGDSWMKALSGSAELLQAQYQRQKPLTSSQKIKLARLPSSILAVRLAADSKSRVETSIDQTRA